MSRRIVAAFACAVSLAFAALFLSLASPRVANAWSSAVPSAADPCANQAVGQLCAKYFNNTSLTGNPVFSQLESSPLGHDWGAGGPGHGVNADSFSARWTGTFNFAAGDYSFLATADDGVRVWVDGQLIIDRWLDQAPATYQATRVLTAGTHTVRMDYYEHLGGAVAKLSWVAGCPAGEYRAEYFGNKTLSGSPAFIRCEMPPIGHSWGAAGPGSGLGAVDYSVRWTGTFGFSSGNYAFWVTGDDGVRLWVDGQLLIDRWLVQAPTEYRATKSLTAGNHVVKLEYFQNQGGAVARASWIRGADVGLDPGHSRVDPGACGAGQCEYQLTLDIASRARTILQAAGYSVNLSRTNNNSVSSWSAGSYDANLPIEMAARIKAVGPVRAYVPIHLNGSSNRSIRGTTSYYNVANNAGGRSYLLASDLQSRLVGRIRQAGYWAIDRGVKSDLTVGKAYGHYYSLRGPYPSALVECLFLSNATEASQLTKSSIRQAIAQGIADGVIAYLRAN